MKVLHVCKKYPDALGGDAVVVYNLQKQQRALGYKLVIVTSNCDEIADGPNIYKFGLKDTTPNLDKITLRRLISLIVLFFRMFAILRQERPDVIHTHSVDMAFFSSFAARFYRIPMVHTFHIVTFYDASQSFIRRKYELWLAKRAKLHSVTAPNVYDVEKLQAAGLKQTKLLPNGVDTVFWRPEKNAKKFQKFTFVMVGRLEEQKGIDYLIKAAALLAETSYEEFSVIVVGEGSQETSLRWLADDLGVEEIVSFVGRQSPQEIRVLLSQAGAAIFPSLYESTPITMLEAWATKVPVIVTSVGIVRDAPTDFGAAYVVPPKDEAALMQAMERCMIDAELRDTVAAKGYEEVKKYAWPAIARTTAAIYGDMQ